MFVCIILQYEYRLKNIYNIVKAKGMITNEKNIIIISSSLRRNGNSQLLCNQFMQGEH